MRSKVQEKLFRKDIGYFKAEMYDLVSSLEPTFFLEGTDQWSLGVGQAYRSKSHSLKDLKNNSIREFLPLVQSDVDPKTPLYQIVAPFDPDKPVSVVVPEITITGTRGSSQLHVTYNHLGYSSDTNSVALERVLSTLNTAPTREPHRDKLLSELEPLDLGAWRSKFEVAIEAIETHAVGKVVLSLTSQARKTEMFSRSECMRRLKQSMKSSHLFCTASYIGITPELVLSLQSGVAKSTPLAGTRKTENSEELSTSQKDIHEHDVVVEAITTGLRSLAQSVESSKPLTFEAGPITHIATEIRATDFKDNVDLLSILANVAPTPAICGDPQDVALSIVRELEGDRGFFGGLVGTMDSALDGEVYLAIRSLRDLGDKVRFQAGVGLVDGSEIDQEFTEISQKIASVYRPLGGYTHS